MTSTITRTAVALVFFALLIGGLALGFALSGHSAGTVGSQPPCPAGTVQHMVDTAMPSWGYNCVR